MAQRTRKAAQRTHDAILSEYDKHAPVYAAFGESLRELISMLIEGAGIRVHSVTCRLKARQSLNDKIVRADDKYYALEDITDICGIRIITHFPDTVDEIAQLLEREFTIDRENSVDKRIHLDPDRFGYLSLHHVISIGLERSRLAEYRRFADLKAEVQSRSLLQHTWAEIEHDLGYKSGPDVPKVLRRRFARLAGILELADEEFQAIRDELKKYEKQVGLTIDRAPQNVGLDKASLTAFATKNRLVAQLDQEIAANSGARLVPFDDSSFEGDAERLMALGINSISELELELTRRRSVVAEFAREWLKDNDHSEFSQGISLFYFWYVLLASSLTPQQIRQQFQDISLDLEDRRNETADTVLKTYKLALERSAAGETHNE